MPIAGLLGASNVSVASDNSPALAAALPTDGAPSGDNGGAAAEDLLGPFGRQLRKHRLSFRPVRQTVGPRRNLYVRGEPCMETFLICEGWACRVARLSNGRRQILSFLLPGDLFSAMAAFRHSLDFHIEAITEVRFAGIDNVTLRSRMTQDPQLLESYMEACIAESAQAQERLVNLGQRLAEERIAVLILQLMGRLERRGMVSDQSFEFPLRQLQIADAVGITPVHVNRVMRMLRSTGLIETDQGRLRVRDLPELRRIGGMR